MATGTCEMIKCSSAPPGHYYTNFCQTAPCNSTQVAPGFRFKRGWAIQPDTCPTERCDGNPGVGEYFVRGCETLPCNKAPLGYCYVLHGGVDNDCPFAPCTNAKVGERYESSWAVGIAGGKTIPCDALITPGFRFKEPGSCDLIECPVAPRGMYYDDGCKLDACVNGNVTTYYIYGFADDKMNCPVRDCKLPPPPGLFFADMAGCNISECSNAGAGYYYMPETRERSLVHGECRTAACAVPPPGRYFINGHATSAGTCPSAKCDASRLLAGSYFGANCSVFLCPPARAGYYYLLPSTEGKARCASVIAKCTNAGRGQKYTMTEKVITTSTGCPVVNCSSAPIGRYYIAGTQCSRTAPCTGALAGQYYTSGGGIDGDSCSVASCENVKRGEYYSGGSSCDVRKCFRLAGYDFTTPGRCAKLARCTSAPVGHYYSSEGTEPCFSKPCAPTLTNFLPGFSTSRDQCPQCTRQRSRGECYVFASSCETHPCGSGLTTNSTNTTIENITSVRNFTAKPGFRYVAKDDATAAGDITLKLVLGISICGVSLVVIIVVIIVAKRCQKGRHLETRRESIVSTVISVTQPVKPKPKPKKIVPTVKHYLRMLTGEDYNLVHTAILRDETEGNLGLRALSQRLNLCSKDRVYANNSPAGFEPDFATLLAFATAQNSQLCKNFLRESEGEKVEGFGPVTIQIELKVPESATPGEITVAVSHARLFDVVVPAMPAGSAVMCTLTDPAMVCRFTAFSGSKYTRTDRLTETHIHIVV